MKLIILGSTGSIGVQALEVIKGLKGAQIEVVGLACGGNIESLMLQISTFKPKAVYVAQEKDIAQVEKCFDGKVYSGASGIEELINETKCDMVLNALSGFLGLKPTLCAIKNGCNVALANKESLVAAGEIVMNEARKQGVKILPVDSEHSAIFQCLEGSDNKAKNLIITASGGPFLNKSVMEIQNATIEQTLAHPMWKMGKKITVDSATLMNKGLEVIEAHHLFNMPYENIKVVVHPQSLVHSAVEFFDGSILAQVGLPSMHLPIQYALTYPKRLEGIKTESFDFFDKTFEFFAPDFKKFPALELAYEAGKGGASCCVVLNAANEVAVKMFLEGKIPFGDIVKIVEKALNRHKVIRNPVIEEIIKLDEFTRLELDIS